MSTSHPGLTAPRIDPAELQRMLLDIDVPDSAIRPYVIEAASDSGSFRPSVRVNPMLVERPTAAEASEAAFVLGSLNGAARWRRQQRYRRKIRSGWAGLRVVSEGDSWFQYPFLLDDVIDHLWDAYAILSLDAAGDLLTDMVKQGEVVAAVIAERPDVVLLSGGGNDLLGNAQLARVLPPFAEGRAAADYLGERFDDHLKKVLAAYEDVIGRIRAAAPDTAIVCHAYDYALPNKGRWLGRPMASIGISERDFQGEIVRLMIDRFHGGLEAIAARSPGLTLVDSRGAVTNRQWFDELHPDGAGFSAVAQRFASTIGRLTGAEASFQPVPASAQPVASAGPGKSRDVAAAAIYLAGHHGDDALLSELGRRQAVEATGAELDDLGSLAITQSSIEGFFPAFREAGERIVDALHRQLFALVCGQGEHDKADRQALGAALGLGQAAVIGAIATALAGMAIPAAIAAIAAPVIARRILAPTLEALCASWQERLGEDGAAPVDS